ncbi:hypothetical protein [Streptomyces sp. NBC_01089]|uniref:hypothetical protein n=1 Tax=Streptomyces sp. NBC_01089 TaxID=2903747 RepID=UPI003864D17A|nr:hypothetical protein OG510_00860 [Streptomyces sp. NBC_01089]WSU46271.1 hypothetical protein OG510_36290 [Streptomyces sp. NBC_01089]
MLVLVLIGVVVLAAAGCVCVVWAQRGGPRWVRAAASVTLAAGEVVRRSNRRRGLNRTTGNGDG